MAQRPNGQRGDSPQLAAALAYAARGWRVIPLHSPTKGGGCTCGKSDCSSVGKHPRTKNGLKDSSASEAVLRVWWENRARSNVGIVTGGRSSLVVLDVDTRHGGDESLTALQERYGALPETLRVATGGGGEHWYYQHPGGDVLLRNVAGLDDLPGLDVRGDGGYVVAPPSFHKSGARYDWRDESTPVAPLPDWLLQLLQRPRTEQQPTHDRPAFRGDFDAHETGQHWLEWALNRAYEGNRNKTGFDLACQLRDGGLSESDAEYWLLEYANRVPGSGYSDREARSSLRQAYRVAPREAARDTSKASGDYERHRAYSDYAYTEYSDYAEYDSSDNVQDNAHHSAGNGDSQRTSSQVTRDERDAHQTDRQGQHKEKVARFTLMTDEQVESLPPPEWLLNGILVADTLSVVYGEYGSAKSFLALDWALSIATGRAWMNHPVTRGSVVYIAGEGIGGMGKRIRAWKQQHGWTGGATGLHLLGVAPHLLLPEDVIALRTAMRALPEKPALVIIDTLARSMTGGDENSAQDMGRAVAAAESIRVEFGCHVMLVHHKPSGASKTRGSNALPGAAYTLVDVVRDGETIIVSCPKQKDYEEFRPLYCKLLTLCTNEETLETSCVLIPTTGKGRWQSDPQRMTRSAENVLALLREQDGQQMRFNDVARVMEEQYGAVRQTVSNALYALKNMGKITNDMGIWRLVDASQSN